MPVERSAGIIFFHKILSGRKYLVIRSSYHGKRVEREKNSHGRVRIAGGRRPEARYLHANFWDFPKGLLEKDEDGMSAAKREAGEEAGIRDFKIIPGFKETVRYFVRRDRDQKAVLKFVAMFLAEAKDDKIKLSWEHDMYEWLPYEEAKERLSRNEMQKALERAEGFLKRD